MRDRPIKEELKSYEKTIKDQLKEALAETNKDKSDQWTMEELEKVLKKLKYKQGLGMKGHSNKLFHYKNIGEDLKKSILIICNKVKDNNEIPTSWNQAFIKSIPKKRKSPSDLSSERGIFLVTKLRALIMKLVYNSIIDVVEKNLTNSNIGARKNKSPRDHVFVLNAIVEDKKRNKKSDPIDFVFYDVKDAFNSLWLDHTILDLKKN